MSERPVRDRVAIDTRRLTAWYDVQAPFYRLWRDRYDGPVATRVGELLPAGGEPLRVLDAGCGTGLFALALARGRPSWPVAGLDASSGMLAVARRQARRLGLERVVFCCGDLYRMPFGDASWDVAILAGVIPNLNDAGRALRELHRVLRPAGRLIVVEFDRLSMGPGVRLLFAVLIFGQRLIATVLPRFRFAERWNVDASTVEIDALREELGRAGFVERAVDRVADQLVFDVHKGARS